MALSITHKLTVTVALLSLLVLAPGGTAFYLLMERSVEGKGIEQANSTVAATAAAMMHQLDEDLLVEFGGGHVQFEALRVPARHWAVMRRSGQMQGGEGIFTQDAPVTLGAMTQLMRLSSQAVFAVASVPLASEAPLRWSDLPVSVQSTITSQAPNAKFVSARKEVLGDRVLFDIKVLTSDQLLSLEIAATGALLETEQRDLPERLSAGMEADLQSEQIVRGRRIVDWGAWNGELIAIVDGEAPDGQSVRVATNRFGERYELDGPGRIGGKQDASRLWLAVAYDMTDDFASLRLLGRVIAVGGTLIWLLITIVAWQVTRRALKPVDDIVRQTARIGTPDLSERLPVSRANDELSRVAQTVNRMLDRIQEGYQREQQFTGDASHEMRSPLAKMLGEIDWALSRPRSVQEHEDTLRRLQRYAQGMQRLTESLLILARLEGKLQNLEMRPFDIGDLVMELIATLPEDRAQRIHFELGHSSEPMEVVGHRHLIGVLLRNLIDNALQYSPPKSPVDLRIAGSNGHIRIEIQDAGPGIPSEQVALAFNRFHRLEKSRSRQTGGVGLGLSIVKVISEVHRSEISLSTARSGGTVATFTLPAANGHAQSQSLDVD